MKWVYFLLVPSCKLVQGFATPRPDVRLSAPQRLAVPSSDDGNSEETAPQRKRDRLAGLFRRQVPKDKSSESSIDSITTTSESLVEIDTFKTVDANADPLQRNVENLWKEYQSAEAEIAEKPFDVALQRRCADALCGWLRLKTNGNTVTVDGPGDTPEFRSLWRAHAPRAVELYQSFLFDDRGNFEPEDLCNFIECFSSVSGAKGIAIAAVSGDAVVFLRSVNRLKAKHANYNNGLAHIFTAAFYLAAPFPVRSPSKALAAAQEAVACAPSSRRNRYYEGLALLASGNKASAAASFASALEPTATATTQSELDIDGVLMREAARGLAMAQK